MSFAALQANAFYDEVANHGRLWTLRDDLGYPAPMTRSGLRAQPFWSSLARVEKVIQTVPAYAGCAPVEITWPEFQEKWVPELLSDGVLVGLNWSGPDAVGYDLGPENVEQSVLIRMAAARVDAP